MTTTPPPGSDEAVAQGCTCHAELNHHGKGYLGVKGVYGIGKECPLHARAKGTECTCDPWIGERIHKINHNPTPQHHE